MKRFLAFAILLIGVIAFSGSVSGGTGSSAVQVSVQCDQADGAQALIIMPDYCFATTEVIEAVPVTGDALVVKPCSGYATGLDKPPCNVTVNRLNNNLTAANVGLMLSIGKIEPRTNVPPLLMRCRSGDVTPAELTATRANFNGSFLTSDETKLIASNTGILHSWFDIDTAE